MHEFFISRKEDFMRFYTEEFSSVLKEIGSSEDGISSKEALQRLEKNGPNRLKQEKKDSLLKKFLSQLRDPMIIILIIAAFVSAGAEMIEAVTAGHTIPFPTDALIILAVVVINSILGVYQESKAEKAIEALQEISAATSKVLRDGKIVSIKSEELVVGDVVLLEAGDAVPADCRIFENASLKIEEAALTGESVPVNKFIQAIIPQDNQNDVPLGDRKNMAYMGSTVVYGRGKAVVTGTGMDTEMGKIADAISNAAEGQTPLQIKLAQLSKILSVLVLGICIFIFGFNIVQHLIIGEPIDFSFGISSFMTAVSLAVAAIPEGLVAVVTIVLSIGVTNMSERNAIIRRLTAVETLGCAQIICSDKTGTLTQNKMTVVDDFGADKNLTAIASALCSDAEVDGEDVVGEPTEAALVSFALSLNLNKNELKVKYPRVAEAPFDSNRKMMSTIHKTEDGIVQYTKGAPDVLIGRCTKILTAEGVVDITDKHREEISASNKAMANKALRVLAAAEKFYDEVPSDIEPENLEKDLIFVGLTGMIDPVRPEVKDAIAECRSAGITPIMITGDHFDTAVAIAKELGITDDASHAITGAELEKVSDEEFKEKVANLYVYARVQPEHKTRIVNAWRERGMVTAMTGDGVNDAPSIKSADIGIGMGITGTDVTKNVADMVLSDDNFATIVSAVSEGRRIYDNIKKAIQFLLSSNLSEVVAVFVSTLLGFVILKPTHLLFINLITDSLPALALGTEPPEADIMRRKPRSSKEGVFAGGMGFDVVYQGILVAILTLVAYFIGATLNPSTYIESGLTMNGHGMTMAFLTLSLCEIFHSFNMRSQRKSVFKMKGNNMLLFGAMALAFILTTAVIEVPFLAGIFDFTAIGITEYVISILLAVLVIPVVEIVKAIQRKLNK